MIAYAWSILIALGILLVAVLLVIVQRRLTDPQRMAAVGGIFTAGVATNALLGAEEDVSFAEALQQTLEWTYSALTMFAGAGSFDTFGDLLTPGGLPETGLHLVKYFLRVFAFLFTVSAVVAALARDQIDRLALRLSSYDEVVEVHGSSPEAVALARALAASPAAGRRRLLVLVAILEADVRAELVEEQIVINPDLPAVRRKSARAQRLRVVIVDSGEPTFVDSFVRVAAELEELDHGSLTVFAVTSSRARDRIVELDTSFEVRILERAELVGRHLIRTRPPFRDMTLVEGRPTAPYRALVIADDGPERDRILDQLVMNSQFVGATPEITLISAAAELGSFRMRHPELGVACRLETLPIAVGGDELFELVGRETFDQVVVALHDESAGMGVAHDLEAFFRLHRPGDRVPPLLVRTETTGSEAGPVTCFGSSDVVFSGAWLIDEVQDRDAKRVNAFYRQIPEDAPDFDARANLEWRGLTFVNRASSRASADFAPAMRAVADSAVTLPLAEAAELLAQTEHLRWNAFYRMFGYQRMESTEMRARFDAARAEHPEWTSDVCGRYARDDTVSRRHVCLVDWDELPTIDRAYNALPGVAPRNFQDTDRHVLGLVEAIVSNDTAVW